MEIINKSLEQRIAAGHVFSLELGCGPSRGDSSSNAYALDVKPFPGVDIVADLNQPLCLIPDGLVRNIYSRHVFEHISNLIGLMEECHRVLQSDGTMTIVVPHFSNIWILGSYSCTSLRSWIYVLLLRTPASAAA
jgi:predicted SAM-dependent methyltransferase